MAPARLAAALALGLLSGARGLGLGGSALELDGGASINETAAAPEPQGDVEQPAQPDQPVVPLNETVFPVSKDGKVEVALFYETMCPFCHKFFSESLKPLWQDRDFRPLLNVAVHPSGNVQVAPANMVSKGYFFWHEDKVKDEYVFICQHGESECIGNRIHACAKKLLPEEKFMDLAFCMASHGEAMPERSSYQCMEEGGVDMIPIRDCVREPATSGAMFQIALLDDNLQPPRKYVPWVLVNGVHANLETEGDFKAAVCKALGDKAPAACQRVKLEETVPVLAAFDGPVRKSIAEERCYRDGSEPKAMRQE
eukprot:CAMPEP_0197875184 /NCGR_PEP_ID=MMETSP1439-20131203/4497_1 /TAXON_ID=66791 /ORGANISM="Gonyaulax spinifera, Strain CCMP409" /LENGTH=310 /DNA_ID=CAMNT_0043494369 /DNA_START=51 /DNA_END=983 /DNA_ORIENTATION=+